MNTTSVPASTPVLLHLERPAICFSNIIAANLANC